MPVKKIQMRPPENDYQDVLHPETSADMVLASGGTNLQEIADSALTHIASENNPHGVTAAQVGAIPTSSRGVVNGVASLDGNRRVPVSQMPTSYENQWVKLREEVVSGSAFSFPGIHCSEYSAIKIILVAVNNSYGTSGGEQDIILQTDEYEEFVIGKSASRKDSVRPIYNEVEFLTTPSVNMGYPVTEEKKYRIFRKMTDGVGSIVSAPTTYGKPAYFMIKSRSGNSFTKGTHLLVFGMK